MEEQQKKYKLKAVIIVLAFLLGISIVTLAGTLIYKHFTSSMPASVIVPDNIITPDIEIGEINRTGKEESLISNEEEDDLEAVEGSLEETSEEPRGNTQNQFPEKVTSSSATLNATADRTATAISLYNRNTRDNVPFNVANMFPGDTETKYFCVQVSYQDTVTVKYGASIRSGYEKLAEVMRCRIVLLNTGETLYDGLMRDIPASLDHSLNSTKGTTSELYYEITAYLNTSVGNEYQNKSLIADFHWWVEEEGNLIDAPKTGDDSNIFLWTGLLGISLFLLILLWMKQKKEVQNEQE